MERSKILVMYIAAEYDKYTDSKNDWCKDSYDDKCPDLSWI